MSVHKALIIPMDTDRRVVLSRLSKTVVIETWRGLTTETPRVSFIEVELSKAKDIADALMELAKE